MEQKLKCNLKTTLTLGQSNWRSVLSALHLQLTPASAPPAGSGCRVQEGGVEQPPAAAGGAPGDQRLSLTAGGLRSSDAPSSPPEAESH